MAKKKDRLCAEVELEHGRTSSASELVRRIEAVCNLLGSRVSAAAVAEVSTDQLARYIKGESQPAFATMGRMAAAAGVRLDWIWSGQGPMREEGAQASASAGLDLAELAGAIETVEEGLAAAGKAATAAKKAELVAAVYDLFTASGTPVDKGVVLRLVKTAV